MNNTFTLLCEKCGDYVEFKNQTDGFDASIKVIACTDFSIEITCTNCRNKIEIQ